MYDGSARGRKIRDDEHVRVPNLNRAKENRWTHVLRSLRNG